MKNLIIYINPNKKFEGENVHLVKIQIDNSLELGWRRKDIMLVTNFAYEYNGVKAIVVESGNYCPFYPQGSKYNTILTLMNCDLIHNNEIYWLHDMDCYQDLHISEYELGLNGIDMALTDYGRMVRWSTGSVWFRRSAEDIFKAARDVMYKYKTGDEQALMAVTNRTDMNVSAKYKLNYKPEDIPDVRDIDKRVKKLNKSYNFSFVNLRGCYNNSIKPLRVVHFHIDRGFHYPPIKSQIRFFMYGENKLGIKLMSDRLTRVFWYHRVTDQIKV